jgi:hypothetical protein
LTLQGQEIDIPPELNINFIGKEVQDLQKKSRNDAHEAMKKPFLNTL